MDIANNTRCKENIPMLEQVIKLRHECATLLGYPSHAAFKLELKMAKETSNVTTFLADTQKKLIPLAKKELETLLALKKTECQKNGIEFDGKINSWDFHYYNRLLLQQQYKVDHEKIKEYLSFENVLKIMLQLYEDVLGLKFVKAENGKWDVWYLFKSKYDIF